MGAGPNAAQTVLPGISVYLVDLVTGQQTSRFSTDARGSFLLPAVPPGHYQLCWEAPGYVSGCSGQQVVVTDQQVSLSAEAVQPKNDGNNAPLFGQVRFLDNSPTRRNDTALQIDLQAAVRLENTNGVAVASGFPSAGGQFVLSGAPPGIPLRLIATCEGASARSDLLVLPTGSTDLVLSNSSPVIDDLVATLNGKQVLRAAPGATVQLNATVHDPDGDALHYLWLPGMSAGGFVSSDRKS